MLRTDIPHQRVGLSLSQRFQLGQHVCLFGSVTSRTRLSHLDLLLEPLLDQFSWLLLVVNWDEPLSGLTGWHTRVLLDLLLHPSEDALLGCRHLLWRWLLHWLVYKLQQMPGHDLWVCHIELILLLHLERLCVRWSRRHHEPLFVTAQWVVQAAVFVLLGHWKGGDIDANPLLRLHLGVVPHSGTSLGLDLHEAQLTGVAVRVPEGVFRRATRPLQPSWREFIRQVDVLFVVKFSHQREL